MDKLAAINTFVTAAEAGSFVEAGRRLGMSASAVGKAVSRFEAILGGRLLQRNTQGVALTPEGAAFLERSRRILAEIELAQEELTAAQGSAAGAVLKGSLKIGLPSWTLHLVPALAAFADKHPTLILELDFTDHEVDVVGGGYDLVIRAGKLADSTLRGRILMSFRHVLVATPTYLAVHGVPSSGAGLIDHSLILRRSLRSGKLEQWPLREGAHHSLPAAAIVRSVQARVAYACAGKGIARVPEPAVREHLVAGTLISLLEGQLTEGGTLSLLWPDHRHGAAALRALVDHLVRNVSAAPD